MGTNSYKRIKRQVLFFIYKIFNKITTTKNLIYKKETYIFLLALFILLIFSFYPITKITINLQNQELLDNTQITQVKQIIKNQKFFLLNPDRIKFIILNNIYNIQDIQIKKEFPGHLQVLIKETNYIAILYIDKKEFLLTEENRLIPISNDTKQKPSIKGLPNIYSNTYNAIFLSNLHELIQYYNQFILTQYNNPSQKQKLQIQEIYNNISLNQIPTIKIKTKQYIFLISPSKDLKEQIITLKVLLASPSLKYTKFKIIDLRFDRPVIK